jgi:hypothetical protein
MADARVIARIMVAIAASGIAFVATVRLGDSSLAPAGVAPRVEVVAEARADDSDLGLSILKCFHPTADFVRARFGAPYDDEGRRALDGHIDFRGGFTAKPYYMEFVMHMKKVDGDSMIRVTPRTDTAPFPPNEACGLRNWTRVN